MSIQDPGVKICTCGAPEYIAAFRHVTGCEIIGYARYFEKCLINPDQNNTQLHDALNG